MSTDPSPWAEGVIEPDIIEPTAVIVERDARERIEEERQRLADARLWATFANRLTRDGSLIR